MVAKQNMESNRLLKKNEHLFAGIDFHDARLIFFKINGPFPY